MKRLSALWPYFGPHKLRLGAGIGFVLATVILGLYVPMIVGGAVDALREGVSSRTLFRYGASLVGITLVQGLFSFAQRRTLVALSRDIEFDLRNDYFSHLEQLPQAYFQRNYTGDLMARGTNDLQAVRMLCGPAIMYSSNTLFTAAGALFFMIRIHPGLTLLALCTLPLVAISTKVFGGRIHKLFQRVQEQFANLSTHVQENLSGARVVRAYVQEAAEERRFEQINLEYVERNRQLARWTAAFHPLLQGLIGLGFVGVLWYGGLLVSARTVSVGQFVTFTFFLAKLVWPMIAIGWVINIVQRGSASLARILEVVETVPEIRDEDPLPMPANIEGRIRIDNLSFRYEAEGALVLQDIDLEVAPGSTVALVGRTGAGKTTLLALLCRLCDPPPETMFVDGVDLRRLPLAGLRGAMAVVPQESFLFSDSVANNIAYGRPRAGRDEIEEAARIAGLELDLDSFPDGLDTRVGERGITLSGGQKQRVALARALLRRPQILLLDDCLSAVDTHTEEKIQRNLREVLPGRTVFLISHRISAVKDSSQIVVLEGGRIVERGTHEQLAALGGVYAELHRRQQLEEELATV